MAARHIALGNRDKACQARLRRQQVVVAGIQCVVVNAQADMKQVPLGVVQTAEVHAHAQVHALRGNAFKLLLFKRGGVGLVCQAGARTADRQQVTRQVAAVNGGHIGGLQYLQRFSLVPVVQMPVVFGHALYRAKCCLQAVNHVCSADPAKLARAGYRQQIQTNVGGRCAVRQRGLGVHLQVVGRQVVVLWGDAVFKKAPGVLCNARQVSTLPGIKPLGSGLLRRQAHPPSEDGCQCPQDKKCSCFWGWAVEQRQHGQHYTRQ